MESMRKIVVLRPGALGDAVVTLPVLDALASAHPAAKLTVVGSPVFRLAVECGCADEWVSFDDGRLVSLFAEGGSCEVVGEADLCVAYGGCGGAALLSSLERSGVRRVVLWPAQPSPGIHITDHLLAAVEDAGTRATMRTPRLAPQPAWLAAARKFLEGKGIRAGFAAVHPGSGGRHKQWPADRFAEVASRLGRPVVWLVGPAEAGDETLRSPGERAGVVGECLPLPVLAGVLASCDVYVGNDSGVSHLAAAVGAPTVAVFGPTDPGGWAPRGERVVVVGGPERGGLEAVGVDEVVDAVRRTVSLSPAP